MEFQQLFDIGQCPILFPDGGFGLVIRWDDIRNEIGIQRYPGTDNIEWVNASKVTDYGGGALVVTDG